MNLCAIDQSRKTDAKLDLVYEKLIAKISPAGQEKLQAAKIAWFEFRNKQCIFDTLGSEGGSIHVMVFAKCYEDLTLQYIKHLQEQLECKEGNASCGSQ